MINKRKLFGLIAVGLVSTAAGFWATGGLDKIKSESQDTVIAEVPEATTTTQDDPQQSDKVVERPDTSTALPPSEVTNDAPSSNMKIRVSRNPVASANGTFTFSVIASGIPPYADVVYTFNQGKRGWANSKTGTFSGVAPDTRTVIVYALAKRDGKLVAKAETSVAGFDKMPNNTDNEKASQDKPKLSVSQVATMFSNREKGLRYSDDHLRHPLIAKHLSLSFSGLRPGDAKPQVINDIYDKLNFGLWQSANVVSLSYDKDNKVNGIHFSVTYPD